MERPADQGNGVDLLRRSIEVARDLGLPPDNIPLYHLARQQINLLAQEAPVLAGTREPN